MGCGYRLYLIRPDNTNIGGFEFKAGQCTCRDPRSNSMSSSIQIYNEARAYSSGQVSFEWIN